MRIQDLLSNSEFSFNAPVRILRYLDNDNTQIMYDGTTNENAIPDALMTKFITAINIGDDLVMEIEYTDFQWF